MTFNNILAGLVTYPAGATFGPRVLSDYEFVYIHTGDIRWRIDDVEYAFPEGSLVLVKPGMNDFINWDEDRSTTHSFVHFSCEDVGLSSAPLMASAPDSDIISSLMKQIVHLHVADREENWQVIQSAIAHLVQCFLHGEVAVGNEPFECLPYPVERAFEYLRGHWQGNRFKDPGVEQLAKAAGVTQVHLNRLFRQSFGKTPGFVLRALRMTHAAELLLRSNYQIQEIAEQVGAADPYHFSKQFKSVYGISPRAYRKADSSKRRLSVAPLYYQLKR